MGIKGIAIGKADIDVLNAVQREGGNRSGGSQGARDVQGIGAGAADEAVASAQGGRQRIEHVVVRGAGEGRACILIGSERSDSEHLKSEFPQMVRGI